ncbi:helix-turn-helix domain-containing protein [Shimazuella kribbensis]|nr:helix-turn-helix domain-containing protein [Shimazuella kribbensis]
MIKTLAANKTPIKDITEMMEISCTTVYRYLAK